MEYDHRVPSISIAHMSSSSLTCILVSTNCSHTHRAPASGEEAASSTLSPSSSFHID
ncbi:uncharacterized protein EKO05_0002768 [Ascochyta rabiei]|uniref:uncharacterized protein n=1 Tax=Didymella rabiei TaxID=5454 RepID=UPI002206EEC1|nr:uncharacterized protein EKO05_0002768 [Ascochyta rabiei]UPX12205.1 hypothetical protein EKO05_0002768 [Ascochyta rabiei]